METDLKDTRENYINGLTYEEATAIRDQRFFDIESNGIAPIYSSRLEKRWKKDQTPFHSIGRNL